MCLSKGELGEGWEVGFRSKVAGEMGRGRVESAAERNLTEFSVVHTDFLRPVGTPPPNNNNNNQ